MKNEKLIQSIITKGYISRWSIIVVWSLLIVPVLFITCEYNNKPGIIYDPNQSIDNSGKPIITGITPASVAAAGVREITINGSSLGIKNGDTNWVFIGGVRPLIKEIHDSFITIYRPKLSNDHYDRTISLSVTDPKLLTESSNFSYSVETPGVIVGDYLTSNSAMLAVDFDSLENLYVMLASRNLIKNDFAGVTQITVLNPSNLLSGGYASTSAICFGPGPNGRNLFIANGQNNISRIAVFDTANKVGASFVRPKVLPVPAVVSAMDFDEKGNIYVAGNSSLYTADTSVGNSAAPIFTSISGYTGVNNIVKIRVVKESGNEYIYIADSMHIWKSQLSGGSLVMGTPKVDLGAHSELNGCTISSFDIDVNGSIFLCLKNNPNYSLFFVESDGSITAFYKDPAILPNTVDRIVWGNNIWGSNKSYLYLVSGSLQSAGVYASARIYRMTLDRNGAPYLGRTFIRTYIK